MLKNSIFLINGYLFIYYYVNIIIVKNIETSQEWLYMFSVNV